jgi:hypothetical protein
MPTLNANSTDDDRRYEKLVRTHMIHRCIPERCYKGQKGARAYNCKYGYPFDLHPETTIDQQGRVLYRRRAVEDRVVVAHNRNLLLRWNAHINIEIAGSSKMIRYMRKVQRHRDRPHIPYDVIVIFIT